MHRHRVSESTGRCDADRLSLNHKTANLLILKQLSELFKKNNLQFNASIFSKRTKFREAGLRMLTHLIVAMS